MAVALAVPALAAAASDWEALRGRPVVDVRVHAGEVFDPARPGENYFFCHWANALHVRTRAHVIRRELLVDVGDVFDPERIAESERNLRGLEIFQDVSIDVEEEAEGVVVVVRTSDRWTTELRTELSSQGGISQVGLGLSDVNLFGRAFELGGSFTSSTDVDAAAGRWRDPRLLGTRWGGAVALRHDDLQRSLQVGLDHPFYSETVRWSAAAAYTNSSGDRRLFDSGEEVDRLDVSERRLDGWAALHRHGDALQRWALVASRRRQRGDIADDAGLVAVAWSVLARRYFEARDIDFLGAVEDLATGATVQLGAGADLRALGATHDRSFVRSDLAASRRFGSTVLLGCQWAQYAFLDARAHVDNGRAAFETFGFWQTPGAQTLAWRLGAGALVGEHEDLRFNLGGDDRLRGYEARHLSGERVLYGSLEERLFTDWRLFFLRLGAVAFVDAAAAWDEGEVLARDRARLGGGVGLRVATNRAGSSVTGVDLAFGTDSVQLSITTGQWFRVARGLTYLDPRPFR